MAIDIEIDICIEIGIDIGVYIYIWRERYAATDIGINISRVREEESFRDTLMMSPVHGQIDEDI